MAYSDEFPDRSARAPLAAALLDPAYLRDLIARRGRRIAIVSALLFVAFILLIVVIGPRYSATAILLVDPRQPRVVQSDVVLSGIGNDMAAVDSQVEVVQSTPIARKVIADLKLAEDPEFAPSANPLAQLARLVLGDRSDERDQYVLSQFSKQLKVRRRGLTYVLEVEFASRSAAKSARIANAVAEAYVAQQASARVSATAEASSWLGDRLAGLRKQAADAEAAVARFREENNLVNTGDRRSLVEQQLADINQQIVLAAVRTGEIRARLKQIEKAASSHSARQALVDTLNSPVIAGLRAQYAQAAKSAAELAQSLGPRHPAIRTSQAELEALNRQIDDEIGRLTQGVKNELEAALNRERALDGTLAKLKTQAAQNEQALVRLHELEREAEAAQAILQRSLNRYKETKEQEGLQIADARVLSPAIAPLAPNGPSRKLLAALAAIVSALLAFGGAFLVDQMQPKLASAARRPRGSRLPVLGYLPRFGDETAKPKLRRGKPARAGDAPLSAFALKSPFSPFNDAVRRLAADFALAHPNRPYVLALVGARADVGVSTFAAAFADTLARSGESVALFDASLRPIGAGQQPLGLVQANQAALPIEFAVQTNRSGGADVLRSGAASERDFAPILAGEALAIVLERLRSRYGVLVIDAGAAADAWAAQRLVAAADSALLVTDDKADADRDYPAIEAKLDGVVLSKVDLATWCKQRAPAVAPSPEIRVAQRESA